MTGTAARDGGFASVLSAAREGDAPAWGVLYHDVAPILIGYLRAQHLPDPDDVAGEVLLEVVRDLHRFEGDERGFRSWVLAIAHHRLLDARRRASRRPLESPPDAAMAQRCSADDTEAETLAAMGLDELGPALRTLTDDQRTVLLLRVVGDLAVADVAAVMGKRPGAIKQLQRRAAEALRRALDAERDAERARPTPVARPADARTPVRVASPSTDAHAVGGMVQE